MGILPACTDLCTTCVSRMMDPLKLEFQAVVSSHVGCLGIEPGFSRVAAKCS